MKTALYFAFLALLSALCSCASITPPPTPDPTPQPIPVQPTGFYVIRELNQDGKMVREWGVDNYRHTLFPRSVSFVDGQGKTVKLTGSFEIQPAKP